MVMSWIWTGLIFVSILTSVLSGRGSELAAATAQGGQAGITLALSMAGSVCLWSGVGKVMEHAGFTGLLSRLLMPVLGRLFPSCKTNTQLSGCLSANICANILGLGNAATPMGIQAAQHMAKHCKNGTASNELCRLVVLNTASIQLIPANVAAIRVNLGSSAPFDILPAVWITSFCAAAIGLLAAWVLGKLWPYD